MADAKKFLSNLWRFWGVQRSTVCDVLWTKRTLKAPRETDASMTEARTCPSRLVSSSGAAVVGWTQDGARSERRTAGIQIHDTGKEQAPHELHDTHRP